MNTDGRSRAIGTTVALRASSRQFMRKVTDCPAFGRSVGIRRRPARKGWGFRMPLAEPGVHLSICTGLSIDVHA